MLASINHNKKHEDSNKNYQVDPPKNVPNICMHYAVK